MEWPGENSTGGGLRVEQRRQFLDRDVDQIGGVFGDIGVDREHRGDRIADIAHALLGQHRLAVRIERRDRALAEIDRRHLGNVVGGPHREHAGQRARRRRIDRGDAAMRVSRAHDAHMELMRKIDVAGKRATPGNERRILKPRDGLADPLFHAPQGGGRRERIAHTRRPLQRAAGHGQHQIAPELGGIDDVLHRIDRGGGGRGGRAERGVAGRGAAQARVRPPQCAAV